MAPAHISPAQEIKDRLGLAGVEAFALSQQNCASGIAAVDTAANCSGRRVDPATALW